MTNAKRFPADEAIHHTGQRGLMVVLASDHDAETERLQRHLDSRNEQIDGYERQLGIDKAGAEHTIGSEIERLTRERDVSRAAIEQLHAAVKTAQELAARRLMEVERLEAARKHWHEKWNEALTELDGYRTAEFRKNWNALNAPEPCEPRCEDRLTLNDVVWRCTKPANHRDHERQPESASRDASSEPCEHLRSEFLAQKLSAQPPFEMRKCLDCTKIFRKRLTVKSG